MLSRDLMEKVMAFRFFPWFPPWIQGTAGLHLRAVVVAAAGEIHSGDLSDRHQFSFGFLDHLGWNLDWNLMKVGMKVDGSDAT